MDMQTAKSIEVTRDQRISFADGSWLVPSQTTSGVRYRVDPSATNPRCECEQFQLTAHACKHVLAVRALLQRQLSGKPAPEVPQRPKRPTYSQPWSEYNAAKQAEKDHVQELLTDLCSGVPDAPRKGNGTRGGRTPLPLRDCIFAAVFRAYCGFSTRRFMCDLEEAHRRGHISQMMSFNMPSITMQSEDVTPILIDLIRRSSLPLRAVETSFAVDSTGFAFCKWTRWTDIKYGTPRKSCEWVKVHVCVGTKTNAVTMAFIGDKNAGDCPQFDDLLRKTAEAFAVKEASGDKAYLSADNLALVEELGGKPFIPFKVNSTTNGNPVWDRMYHYFMMNRDEFLKRYHQRSNVESTFSAVKRVFGDSVRAKTPTAAVNEVLAKILAFNLTCVIGAWYELGIDPTDWGARKKCETEDAGDAPVILALRRG